MDVACKHVAERARAFTHAHTHTHTHTHTQVGSSFYKDYAGQTLAHRVAECGSVECADRLLAVRRDCVRDVDKEGRTPLIWAAAYDNPSV
jgi:hypothetical protein